MYEYEKKCLSFNDFLDYKIEDNTSFIYEIIYKNVQFNFLINANDNKKAIIFGTGAVDRTKIKLPIFDRHSWKNDFKYTTIWYSDPTLLLNDNSGLCWCYGTNSHWYLESIAYIINITLKKIGIDKNNVLFFGSSGGGYTSIILASMLHAKATAINPQLEIMNCSNPAINNLKNTVLKKGESLINERISVLELIKRENYFPKFHIIQNAKAEIDINVQLVPFIKSLNKLNIDYTDKINLSFYYNEEGRNGMPSKEKTIEYINTDLNNASISDGIIDKCPQNSFYGKLYNGYFKSFDKNKLYLILTIDTEDNSGYSVPNLIECDFGKFGNCGVDYIMNELEKRNMEAVFFVNIYEHKNYTGKWENYIENLVKKISDRGHEVGLHTHHESCKLPIYTKRIFECNYEEQSDIIKYGTDFISNITGKRPISHRGGGYFCNDITFDVLNKFGYKFDSSCYYSNTGTGNRIKLFHSYNQPTKISDILEFPVVNCFNDAGRPAKFDINSMNENELISVIKKMKDRKDFFAANFMFHSFSFIDQKGEERKEPFWSAMGHEAYGVSNVLIKRFETFLDYIYNDPDIEVVTFEQYLKLNASVPSFWADGPFCTDTEKSKNALKQFEAKRYNYRYEMDGTYQENSKESFLNFDKLKMPLPTQFYNNNEIIEKAEDILNGKLHVYSRCEVMPYSLDNMDWNCRYTNIPNTFQLYLQSLNPVPILTKAFELNKDIKYLEKAYDFIKCWNIYYKDKSKIKGNKFVFCDHSVSLRSKNIIYFGDVCSRNCFWNKDMFNLLHDIIYSSGIWLADENNYTKSHNHGIMQDEALIYIGFLLNNTDWVKLAKNRLVEQEKEAFTDEFVHTENSPGYAKMVPDLFNRIGKFLIDNGDNDGQKFINDMKNTQEYINWTIKPNGIAAQIGDTSNPIVELYGSESQIKRKSSDIHKIYPKSGYYYYRSLWDNEPKYDTWKMIKSGYVKTAHKHADDLSFMLYSKGYEIFTDCGIYGYNNDKFREYFVSAKAHNTVIIDNSSYKCNKELCNRTGILKYEFFDDYDHIRLFNVSYLDAKITRDFCTSGDLTIIYDRIMSNKEHCYSQLFHLAENIDIVTITKKEVILSIKNTQYNVILKQLGNHSELSVFKGNVNTPDYGIISRAVNHMGTISTLKYDLNAKNGNFITLIAIVNKDKKIRLEKNIVDYDSIKFNNNEFYISDINFKISRDNLIELPNEIDRKYENTTEESIYNVVQSTEYEIKGNKLKCKLKLRNNIKQKYEFAYYLINGNNIIKRIMYIKDTEITFNIKESGKYKVKYYVKCGDKIKSFFAPDIMIKL